MWDLFNLLTSVESLRVQSSCLSSGLSGPATSKSDGITSNERNHRRSAGGNAVRGHRETLHCCCCCWWSLVCITDERSTLRSISAALRDGQEGLYRSAGRPAIVCQREVSLKQYERRWRHLANEKNENIITGSRCGASRIRRLAEQQRSNKAHSVWSIASDLYRQFERDSLYLLY